MVASTVRSLVVSKRTKAPVRPVVPAVSWEPSVTVSPFQVPEVVNGRSKRVIVYTVYGLVAWQKPLPVIAVRTVLLSRISTFVATVLCSDWPAFSSTLALSVAGNVYRCTPVRAVAVSSASIPDFRPTL